MILQENKFGKLSEDLRWRLAGVSQYSASGGWCMSAEFWQKSDPRKPRLSARHDFWHTKI